MRKGETMNITNKLFGVLPRAAKPDPREAYLFPHEIAAIEALKRERRRNLIEAVVCTPILVVAAVVFVLACSVM